MEKPQRNPPLAKLHSSLSFLSLSRRWGEWFVFTSPIRLMLAALMIAAGTSARAQDPPPAEETKPAQPAADVSLPSPKPIPEDKLVPTLPTIPVRRGATGFNVQMV